MSLKAENLDLSLTEQRQAKIDINTTCKSVNKMSKIMKDKTYLWTVKAGLSRVGRSRKLY
jgi:hypothetical protein